MKQNEYLRELRENLSGRLAENTVRDILLDYEGFFIAGRAEGKDDDEISDELGSPAMLARSLIEENTQPASNLTPTVIGAAPWRRVMAWLADALVALLPLIIITSVLPVGLMRAPVILALTAPSPLIGTLLYAGQVVYAEASEPAVGNTNASDNQNVVLGQSYAFAIGDGSQSTAVYTTAMYRALMIAALLFYLLYAAFSTVIFRGQTLGKRLLRIRVRAKDGYNAPRGMLAARELVGKLLLPIIIILPFVSFILIFATARHKSLHDLMFGTIVMDV